MLGRYSSTTHGCSGQSRSARECEEKQRLSFGLKTEAEVKAKQKLETDGQSTVCIILEKRAKILAAGSSMTFVHTTLLPEVSEKGTSTQVPQS